MSLIAIRIEDILSDLADLKSTNELSEEKKQYLNSSNDRLLAYLGRHDVSVSGIDTEEPISYINKICISKSFKTHGDMRNYISDFVDKLKGNDFRTYAAVFHHYHDEAYNNRLFFS